MIPFEQIFLFPLNLGILLLAIEFPSQLKRDLIYSPETKQVFYSYFIFPLQTSGRLRM